MKKLIALILAMVFMLTLTACDNSAKSPNSDNSDSSNNNKPASVQSNNDNGDNNLSPSEEAPDNAPAEINAPGEDAPISDNSKEVIALSDVSSDKIGSLVQFGGFNWFILDVKDGEAFVLSENILETRVFHNKAVAITWEKCDLRGYLNGEFYDDNFSDDEKALITESALINHDNPEYGTSGGNDTVDKIFLLSLDEVEKYMGDDAPAALKNARMAEGGNGYWALRTPGDFTYDKNVCCVYSRDGHSDTVGDTVDNARIGVRPAMRISLD